MLVDMIGNLSHTGSPKPPDDKVSKVVLAACAIALFWFTFGPSIVMLMKD